MTDIIEVEFKGGRTEQCKNTMEFPFEVGDFVIVEVDKGEHLGKVSHIELKSGEKNPEEIEFRVLRKAVSKDLQAFKEICCREQESMRICKRKVMEHNLPACPQSYARIAAAMGRVFEDDRQGARLAVAAVRELSSAVGLPTFGTLGVRESDFEAIARASAANGSNDSNARRMEAADYLALLRKMSAHG